MTCHVQKIYKTYYVYKIKSSTVQERKIKKLEIFTSAKIKYKENYRY